MAGPGFLAACHPHRGGACSLQSRTTSRNMPRSGWLRSLYNLFGFGKQQEALQAASILSAVRAAEPVRRTRADRADPKRWQARRSIEHEDPAL